MKRKKERKEEIVVKPHYKHRVPHKPTIVHRDRKKYSRKGKTQDKLRTKMSDEIIYMPGIEKYSLWLMPGADVYNKLSSLIIRLSRKYRTPVFEPHVTLIGELTEPEDEIITKTQVLAARIMPYTITLTHVEFLNEYFRCLFIKVQETEEIIEANAKARETFCRTHDPKHMPHLSLMYGNLEPGKKKEIVKDIGKELHLSFEANSIHLFSNTGDLKEWYRIKEFPFSPAK